MKSMRSHRLASLIVGLCVFLTTTALHAQKSLLPGFQVELMYSHPEISHPTVVTCDDAGNLFVGEDPMDMGGPTTKEFDRIQYLVFNADGSVKRKTVFAENLSAVFGMIWHDGALYVMHAPHYTMFKDTDGDGIADVRQELADGFGPPAGIYGFNDHIVTGTRLGLDGRVYISIGDKGVPLATGKDGSTVSLEGGGVIRMRLDGTELEIHSAGTRNHLDVAMDSFDNIFTYDNTDDGLGWWTRYTHHIETGYYGYPFDYHPHPERHLPRMEEYGGGSPVGGACYRDDRWPAEFRDAVFFCEWGKGKVQIFENTPQGATFKTTQKDFLVPEKDSVFRPQDLCFSPDGRYMYLADWNFGGWTQPVEAGRLYRISYVGEAATDQPRPLATDHSPLAEQVQALSSPSFDERMRAQRWFVRQAQAGVAPLESVLNSKESNPHAKIHALWGLSLIGEQVPEYDPVPRWLDLLNHPEAAASVRAQAIRAIGLRQAKTVWGTYDVAQLTRRELATRKQIPTSSAAVRALVAALQDADASIRLRAAVALGRMGETSVAPELFQTLGDEDDFVRFAAVQALRALNDWSAAKPAVTSKNERLASGAVLAMTHVYDTAAIQGLQIAVENSPVSQVRVQALDALAEVYRRADPYVKGWWGTRPAMSVPSRPHIHDWEGSFAVEEVLEKSLASSQPIVRGKAAQVIATLQIKGQAEKVSALAAGDPEESVRIAALKSLAALKETSVLPILVKIVQSTKTSDPVREQAVETIGAIGSAGAVETLIALVQDNQSSAPLISRCITVLKNLGAKTAADAIVDRLQHADVTVRSEAILALGVLLPDSAESLVVPSLTDSSPDVRIAALQTLALIKAKSSVPEILKLTTDDAVQREAVIALAALEDRRALGVYLSGIVNKNPAVRDACRNAIRALKKEIQPDLIELHQRHELAPEIRRELGELMATPEPVRKWDLLCQWFDDEPTPAFHLDQAPDLTAEIHVADRILKWQQIETKHPAGRVEVGRFAKAKTTSNAWSMAYLAVNADRPIRMNYALGSDDKAILYVNGEKVYEYLNSRGWADNQGKGSFLLRAGVNHIWFQCGNIGGPWDFSLALGGQAPELAFLYEDIPPALDLNAFRKQAMSGNGNVTHGKALFFDLQGIGCVKCHSIGDEGTAKVGPNLLGVGTRYPREELIRSVLEPSSRIFTGYEMTVLATEDGKIFQGIIKNENEELIELVDTRGETITLRANSIEERKKSNLSAMPNGLEKGMSLTDFSDIIAYLESLKGEAAQP